METRRPQVNAKRKAGMTHRPASIYAWELYRNKLDETVAKIVSDEVTFLTDRDILLAVIEAGVPCSLTALWKARQRLGIPGTFKRMRDVIESKNIPPEEPGEIS